MVEPGSALRGLSQTMHVSVRSERHCPPRSAPLPEIPPRHLAFIVEDEDAIRELLRLHLTVAGFDVVESSDGHRALAQLRTRPFDIILLDLMLPGIDGLALCRAARLDGANVDTPILMLTARRSDTDLVLGLQSGADDYVTKPFGVQVLLARVEALLRRRARHDQLERGCHAIAAAEVTIDADRRHVVVRGQSVSLTRQEFDVLHLLAVRRGVVFSRQALLAHAWPRDVTVTGRTVDTVVSRLRRKIEVDPAAPALLLTAWGVGYKFAGDD